MTQKRVPAVKVVKDSYKAVETMPDGSLLLEKIEPHDFTPKDLSNIEKLSGKTFKIEKKNRKKVLCEVSNQLNDIKRWATNHSICFGRAWSVATADTALRETLSHTQRLIEILRNEEPEKNPKTRFVRNLILHSGGLKLRYQFPKDSQEEFVCEDGRIRGSMGLLNIILGLKEIENSIKNMKTKIKQENGDFLESGSKIDHMEIIRRLIPVYERLYGEYPSLSRKSDGKALTGPTVRFFKEVYIKLNCTFSESGFDSSIKRIKKQRNSQKTQHR